MKKKFVDEYHWIEENGMLDLVAIAQSSPGPIAVNRAIVVGYKAGGNGWCAGFDYRNNHSAVLIISVISRLLSGIQDNFCEPDARRDTGRCQGRDCIGDV